jgi:apolipoprotein N-acyltransferase
VTAELPSGPAREKASATHALILAAGSGTLLAVAFPYPSLWLLAWIGLVPLILALAGHPAERPGRSVARGFGLGYVFGLFFLGITLRWSAELDPPGTWALWMLFTAIEALGGGVFGALAAWLLRGRAGPGWRPLAVATAWTGLEYIRTLGPYALTWSQLSYSQLPTGVVVQMADLTGASGVTFVIAMVNAAVAEAMLWREQNGSVPWPGGLRKALLGSGLLLAACLLYGIVRPLTLPAPTSTATSIACVQPDVDPHVKWDRARFADNLVALERATDEAVDRDHAELVVWPETALPEPILTDPPVLQRVSSLAARKRVYILVGSTEAAPDGSRRKIYNTAMLFGPSGQIQGRYDKMHLVPFGEFLPLRPLLAKVPPFNEIVDLTAGEKETVFEMPHLRFATLICFESTFSDLTRTFIAGGAQLIVVITNDGWFNRTSAAEHHFAMSAMRAIEDRIWVVQCGNTGISGFIDPRGRATDKTALFVPAVVAESIQPGSLGSVYLHLGDWFAAVLGLVFVGCVVLRLRA